MSTKVLHIVALDVPFPPDYGGAIDIFYRAKALKENGVKVILHCFEYGRGTRHAWKEIADEIHFYPRSLSLFRHFQKEPFIVATRHSEELVERLLADDHPILLEGHHCAGLLSEPRLQSRKKAVRIHNVEWKYYEALSRTEQIPWKKLFFKRESRKLQRFEKVLSSADALFCLSETEREYYQKLHPNVYLLPVGCDFHPLEEPSETKGFALFHGNLSVAENENAVRWIVTAWQQEKIKKPLIIAGKDPSSKLADWLNSMKGVELKANLSQKAMLQLIRTAEIQLLFTFQATGVKLKLINALLNGNRCLANSEMTAGTGLEKFCEKVTTPRELAEAVKQEGTVSDRAERITYLKEHFDPKKNALRFWKDLGS